VDNEGAGRKKSKICCIYRKPRAFDESSDESSASSDESDSDSHRGRREHDCEGHGHGHNHAISRRNVPIGGETKDIQEKNAYESAPADKEKGKGKGKEAS